MPPKKTKLEVNQSTLDFSRANTRPNPKSVAIFPVKKTDAQVKSSTITGAEPNTTSHANELPKRKQRSEEIEAESPPAKLARVANEPVSSIGFVIHEQKGDLFAYAPDGAVLIHACNCQGHWGAGIAAAFRSNYPNAYRKHTTRCQPYVKSKTTKELLGTAQLISPSDRKRHFVGCLFTSDRFGRAKNTPSEILAATKDSMVDLISQINDWNSTHDKEEQITAVYMCKINSGLFNVKWEDTKKMLQELDTPLVNMEREIQVRDRT